MITDKDCLIVKKTAKIKRMMENIRNLTNEWTEILKKAKDTDNLKKTICEKNKEIFNLKVVISTKDGLLANYL